MGRKFTTYWGAEAFDTGWRPCSDWRDTELGSEAAKNIDGNIIHNLNVEPSHLWVNCVFTDDPDAPVGGEFFGGNVTYVDNTAYVQTWGWMYKGVAANPLNEITVQTGADGVSVLSGAGGFFSVDDEEWMYRVVLVRMI